MKSNHWTVLLCLAILMAVFSEAGAQSTRKRTNKRTEKKEVKKKETENEVNFFRDQMIYEIRLGNLGFFNGFSISTKLNAGYRISDHFAAGIGGKFYYDQFIQRGAPDISYFDRGIFGWARGKVSQEIYIQAEYGNMYYDRWETSVSTPLIGAGYMSGFGRWKFGLELMYIINDAARDLQGSVVEYWVGASYNF
jgi:hypothetical protein